MPRFWLTEERTLTLRTLVEAPDAQAVHKYYLASETVWTSPAIRETTDHQIVSAENNQRAAGLVPDVQVDAEGNEIDE